MTKSHRRVSNSDRTTAKPAPGSALVNVTDVTKTYLLGQTHVEALKGVSLEIKAGEFLAICGPSGSGKTTLLNLIGCLERPNSGTVEITGRQTAAMSDNELSDLRAASISFVFQSFNLFPVLTALENIEYPLLKRNMSAAERTERAQEALASVGLPDHAHHRPLQLSGGQRQRVAVARAIVTEPALVLADEPTANLDQATGEGILDLMQELNKTKGSTFVFSTHDQKVMDRATRLVPLWDGRLRSRSS